MRKEHSNTFKTLSTPTDTWLVHFHESLSFDSISSLASSIGFKLLPHYHGTVETLTEGNSIPYFLQLDSTPLIDDLKKEEKIENEFFTPKSFIDIASTHSHGMNSIKLSSLDSTSINSLSNLEELESQLDFISANLLSSLPLVHKISHQRMIPISSVAVKDSIPGDLKSTSYHIQTGAGGDNTIAYNEWVDTDPSNAGEGIIINIVDSGVEATHVELKDSFHSESSLNAIGGASDRDISPRDGNLEKHGTASAGIIVGKAGNDVCAQGIAFDASWSATRLISDDDATQIPQAILATAMSHDLDLIDIYTNSWSCELGGLLCPISTEVETAVSTALKDGRKGKGTIYVFAAGNEHGIESTAHHFQLTGQPYIIVVGATNQAGGLAEYSNYGGNVMVSAPSSDPADTNSPGLPTVDITGTAGYSTDECAPTFGGTSAACPQVAGVIALMLSENPSLNYRQVQDILIRTAKQVSESDTKWVRNQDGLTWHPGFGFGLVQTAAAVTTAKSPPNLKGARRWTVEKLVGTSDNSIPDGGNLEIKITESSFDYPVGAIREWVQLNINLSHELPNDISITLTAPSGTKCPLLAARPDTVDLSGQEEKIDWSFAAVCYWGEQAKAGDWTVTITDENENEKVGAVLAASIDFYGGSSVGLTVATLLAIGIGSLIFILCGSFLVLGYIKSKRAGGGVVVKKRRSTAKGKGDEPTILVLNASGDGHATASQDQLDLLLASGAIEPASGGGGGGSKRLSGAGKGGRRKSASSSGSAAKKERRKSASSTGSGASGSGKKKKRRKSGGHKRKASRS